MTIRSRALILGLILAWLLGAGCSGAPTQHTDPAPTPVEASTAADDAPPPNLQVSYSTFRALNEAKTLSKLMHLAAAGDRIPDEFDRLVDSGLLTEERAEAAKGRFRFFGGAKADFNSKRVMICDRERDADGLGVVVLENLFGTILPWDQLEELVQWSEAMAKGEAGPEPAALRLGARKIDVYGRPKNAPTRVPPRPAHEKRSRDMAELGKLMLMYGDDNRGRYPTDLATLIDWDPDLEAQMGSADELERQFGYVPGQKLTASSGNLLLYDRTLGPDGKNGVVYVDLRRDRLTPEELKSSLASTRESIEGGK